MKSFLQSIIQFFMDWIASLQARKDPVPVPHASLEDRLTNLMLARNNTSFVKYYPVVPVPGTKQQIDAFIPALTPESAREMARALLKGGLAPASWTAQEYLVFIVAAMYQESKWAPAYNHNLTRWQGVESFDGTDWGCGQFSGKVARSWPELQNLSEAQMQSLLMDPSYGAHKFQVLYTELLNKAQTALDDTKMAVIAQLPDWCFQPTGDIHEIHAWYATVAYNAGPTGVEDVIASGGYKTHTDAAGNKVQIPEHHGHAVQTWMKQFRPLLVVV